MYPVYTPYTAETVYTKNPPQSDPLGGHCVALEEQGVHNKLFFPVKGSCQSLKRAKCSNN